MLKKFSGTLGAKCFNLKSGKKQNEQERKRNKRNRKDKERTRKTINKRTKKENEKKVKIQLLNAQQRDA